MQLTQQQKQEAIETLENMLNAECLVVGEMEANNEEDIDRRVLRALTTALRALKSESSVEGLKQEIRNRLEEMTTANGERSLEIAKELRSLWRELRQKTMRDTREKT